MGKIRVLLGKTYTYYHMQNFEMALKLANEALAIDPKNELVLVAKVKKFMKRIEKPKS